MKHCQSTQGTKSWPAYQYLFAMTMQTYGIYNFWICTKNSKNAKKTFYYQRIQFLEIFFNVFFERMGVSKFVFPGSRIVFSTIQRQPYA